MELMTSDGIANIEDFYYARMAYYYARPGITDDHVLISKNDVQYIERQPWLPELGSRYTGSAFYQAEDAIENANNTQLIVDNLWADEQMLLWMPTVVGDEKTFNLDVTVSGNYKLQIVAANTPSSGKMSAYINDGQVNFYEVGRMGPTVLIKDLFDPYSTVSRSLFGTNTVWLNVGQHEVDIVYKGKSAESSGSDVGIDFLWLQKL